MKNHDRMLTLMVLGFGIGCITAVMITLDGPTDSQTESYVGEVKGESLPQRCAREYPDDPAIYWDTEREEYMPTNWGWRECMGVGR